MAGIVVGVDSSPGSLAALHWAAAEAQARVVPLVVVHAYLRPLAYTRAGTDSSPEHDHARAVLDEVITAAAAELDGVSVEARLHAGQAAPGLIEAATTADLLVVGARGAGGFEGLLLGSTAEHCARHARCPVIVVRGDGRAPTGRLIVGVDGSFQAREALRWAVAHARMRGGDIEVVSVYEPYRSWGPFGAEFMDVASPGWEHRFQRAAQEAADEAIAAAAKYSTIRITQNVQAGHPARVLIEQSRQADLVVVGSRGLGGFAGLLLGSVSRQLLHHAAAPVAVVRPR